MKNKTKLLSITFILTLIIQFLNRMTFSLSNPVFTEYLIEKGVALQYTGYISSIISWVGIISMPFAGFISDHTDRKKMMLFAYALTTLCLLAYFFADNTISIIIVRIIHGLMFSMTSTLSITFATGFVPLEMLSEAIAILSVGSIVGDMISPQIASIVVDNININFVFILSSIISLIATLLILLLPSQKSEVNEEPQHFTFKNLIAKEALIYMLLISIFSYGNGLIYYFIRMLGKERNIANISIFFTIYSISLVIFKPYMSRLHDKKGIQYILYPAFIINAIAMVLISRAYSLSFIILAAILKAMSQGCATSSLQVESVKSVEKERSGVSVSTCMIGQNIGNAIGPTIGSELIYNYGYEVTFYTAGIMLLIGFFIFYIWRKRQRRN